MQRERLSRVGGLPQRHQPRHCTFQQNVSLLACLLACLTSQRVSASYVALNPVLETTYRFLMGVLSELVDLFPDQCFHIGGDEVCAHGCGCLYSAALVLVWLT